MEKVKMRNVAVKKSNIRKLFFFTARKVKLAVKNRPVAALMHCKFLQQGTSDGKYKTLKLTYFKIICICFLS